jgi:polar amino acid transport system permease protein
MTDLVPLLLKGTVTTVQIALSAAGLALLLAVPLGLGRLNRLRLVRWPCIAYIEFFRGTSLVVQLFWLYFVLPQFGVTLSAITTGIVGIALNYSAYGAEIVRGAVLSVHKSQKDAAFSTGLTPFQALRLVVVPQALVIFIRPWGNLMIQLLKATSLVSMITISDLTYRAYQYNQLTLRTFETFGSVLVIYFVLAQGIAVITNLTDRHFGRWRNPNLARS